MTNHDTTDASGLSWNADTSTHNNNNGNSSRNNLMTEIDKSRTQSTEETVSKAPQQKDVSQLPKQEATDTYGMHQLYLNQESISAPVFRNVSSGNSSPEVMSAHCYEYLNTANSSWNQQNYNTTSFGMTQPPHHHPQHTHQPTHSQQLQQHQQVTNDNSPTMVTDYTGW